MLTETMKRMCGALAIVGLIVWHGGAVAEVTAAARTYDWCYNSCGEETACNIECENDGGGTVTCGEYDGGAANGWCDGNTCDNICTPWSAPTEECLWGGQNSDCETYGLFVDCGDGLCQNGTGGETPGNCPQDCGDYPDIWCGDSFCEAGETYMNCPEDCDDPGSSGYCGDGICSSTEDEVECFDDCVMPSEYCDDNYSCANTHLCVAHQCVAENYITWLSACDFITYGESGCPNGYECRQAIDPVTEQTTEVCIYWYFWWGLL